MISLLDGAAYEIVPITAAVVTFQILTQTHPQPEPFAQPVGVIQAASDTGYVRVQE